MDSFDSNCFSILRQNTLNHLFLFISEVQVFASCLQGVIQSHWCNFSLWILLDAISRESCVDCCAKIFIVHHVLCIIRRLVFLCKLIKFFFCQVEIQHAENLLKLVFSDFSSSKLIKIEKEFFDPDSLHHNCCLKSFLDIKRIIYGMDSLLQKSIVNHI